MVNYSWGDKWDERQRKADEGRFYGPNGGRHYGKSGSGGGGKGYASYPRRGSHTGRTVAIVFVVLSAIGGIVYFFNPLDVKGVIFGSENIPETTQDRIAITYVSRTAEQELISERVTLGSESYRTYTFRPAQAVETYIAGDLNLQHGGPMKLDFLDGDGRCIECGKEFGGKIPINFTAQGGNEYVLRFDNSENNAATLVAIHLKVLYKDPLYDLQTTKVAARIEDHKIEIVPIVDDGEKEIISPIETPVVSEDSLQAYREYALGLINKDREAHGLQQVKLSNNQAAQVFAEDELKQGTLSHWLSNGEKPYMTYSRLGGTGDLSQNVVTSSYSDIESCKGGYYSCPPINPMNDIGGGEHSMMSDDYACCQNGHRDNILAPEHTDVSIGIAYDEFSFYMVQNFENNYIKFNQEMNNGRDTTINLRGDFDGKITQVLVSYDPLPTPALYQLHKDDDYYIIGDYIAGVVGTSDEYYPDAKTIYANSWRETSDGFRIVFDLSTVLTREGVYTISVFGDSGDYKDIQIASYSYVYNR